MTIPHLRVVIVMWFGLFMAQSCNAADDNLEMYVIVPAEKVSVFTQELASLIEQLGLNVQLGSNTDDRGHTLYGLVAENEHISVWSQNVYVTPRTDSARCGRVDESYPDPAQFVVDVEAKLPSVSGHTVVALAQEIRDGLIIIGYEVNDEPVDCSPLLKVAN